MIAFGGRALDKDAQAKYLNSPETPLFHKGDTLYNIAAARQAAHDGATPVVVEGYVDVIAMVNAGFSAAVAPLGTALTENQLMLLWRMADEPILCFDGDRAGQKAAGRAADLALPHLKPGKSLALRAAARRAGSGRSRALGRTRRDRGGDRVGASARRGHLAARDRGRRVCDAGAARGAGGAHQRDEPEHPRRGGAQILSAGSAGAAAAAVPACRRRRPRLSSGRARGLSRRLRRRARPRIGPQFSAPRRQFYRPRRRSRRFCTGGCGGLRPGSVPGREPAARDQLA